MTLTKGRSLVDQRERIYDNQNDLTHAPPYISEANHATRVRYAEQQGTQEKGNIRLITRE